MDPSFRIRPLRLADDQPTFAGGYDPHRHDFQEVIIITQGEAFHRIDWEDHHLVGPHAVMVAQGKMHVFRTVAGTRGWVIEFAPELLPQTSSWIFSHFFALSNVPLDDPPSLKRIQALCGLLEDLHGSEPGRGGGEEYLLAALVSMLDARMQNATTHGQPERNSDFNLLRKFMGLLDAEFRSHKELGYYSQRLKLNPRRLSAACKQVMGRTPAGLLEERCMVEAKRLLVQSELTAQQIAFELGYEDPSYFTKVFRKVVGTTPRQFREVWEAQKV
jgi:AraC family transcriptional activator of pobA